MVIEMPWERERHERDADHILRENAARHEADRIAAQLRIERETDTKGASGHRRG